MKAEISKLMPFVLKWEGKFVNNPNDPGGATNMGVTLEVWKSQGYDKDGDHDIDVVDLKAITVADATKIMEKGYWDRWKASQIDSQAVANILVDWTWCSGAWGIKIPQRLLGLVEDGSVGPKTIEAVNATIAKDKDKFIQQLYLAREQFIKDIIKKNAKLETFKKGWTNRLNDMKTFNLKYYE